MSDLSKVLRKEQQQKDTSCQCICEVDAYIMKRNMHTNTQAYTIVLREDVILWETKKQKPKEKKNKIKEKRSEIKLKPRNGAHKHIFWMKSYHSNVWIFKMNEKRLKKKNKK